MIGAFMEDSKTKLEKKKIIVHARSSVQNQISIVVGKSRIALNSNEARSLLNKLTKAVNYEPIN